MKQTLYSQGLTWVSLPITFTIKMAGSTTHRQHRVQPSLVKRIGLWCLWFSPVTVSPVSQPLVSRAEHQSLSVIQSPVTGDGGRAVKLPTDSSRPRRLWTGAWRGDVLARRDRRVKARCRGRAAADLKHTTQNPSASAGQDRCRLIKEMWTRNVRSQYTNSNNITFQIYKTWIVSSYDTHNCTT